MTNPIERATTAATSPGVVRLITGHIVRKAFASIDTDELADVILAANLFGDGTAMDAALEAALPHLRVTDLGERADRALESQWQAGYIAGNNDAINGTTCTRRRARPRGSAEQWHNLSK